MNENEKLQAAIETLQKQDFGALFVRLDDGTAYVLDVAVEEAIAALREKQTRLCQKPLTVTELLGMVGKPIFVVYDFEAQHIRKWEIAYMIDGNVAYCQSGENWYPDIHCQIYATTPEGERV